MLSFGLQCLKERVNKFREQRVKVDERLKSLEAKQAEAEQELSTLEGVSRFISV